MFWSRLVAFLCSALADVLISAKDSNDPASLSPLRAVSRLVPNPGSGSAVLCLTRERTRRERARESENNVSIHSILSFVASSVAHRGRGREESRTGGEAGLLLRRNDNDRPQWPRFYNEKKQYDTERKHCLDRWENWQQERVLSPFAR